MSDSPQNTSRQERIESQMDGILTEFFSLEVPRQLSAPFLSAPGVNGAESRRNSVTPLSVTAHRTSEENGSQSVAAIAGVSRIRRLVVAGAVAVLAMMMMLMSRTPDTNPPTGQTAAKDAGASNSSVPADHTESLMLVSPGADTSASPVSEDGVTLDEVDAIDVISPK